MKRTVYVVALVIFAAACVCSASAQTNRRGTSAVPGALAALPASDAVMTVDVQRLYREALPRIYASDPAKLAEINSDIEAFKTRTGLDPRAFERVAVGVRIVQTPLGMIKLQPVAIARGTFSAAALVAAGRIAAKGGYQEQQYKGKTIYLFNLGQQVKLLGLRWTNLAVVVLDANTLAFGQPERVRAAVDALNGGARVAADVVALAQHDPNAIIGMGGNVPAALKQIELPSPELSKSVASIRQFYSSFGTSTSGFQMLTVLRTDNADAAHNLSDTVEGLKLLAPLYTARRSDDKGKLLQQLVDNTKVTTAGNDVQISLEVADASVATLVHVF
ncbi:MAG: hypothetical protein DMF64_00640 [Acidobacteria bacterium]|nr:MAG: hypothetical protein DMF64_00640 [Acidobacteriota bacterium]